MWFAAVFLHFDPLRRSKCFIVKKLTYPGTTPAGLNVYSEEIGIYGYDPEGVECGKNMPWLL
jgi:hypothetical protein